MKQLKLVSKVYDLTVAETIAIDSINKGRPLIMSVDETKLYILKTLEDVNQFIGLMEAQGKAMNECCFGFYQ